FGSVGEIGASLREQHFGLEYEAVANDANVRAVAKDLAQPAEKLRPVTSQLLDLVHQGKVQALAEFDDLTLLLFDLGFRDIERRVDVRQLLAQRRELRVELVDPRKSVAADLFFGGETLFGSITPARGLAQTNIASIDLLLSERCPLPLGGKTGFQLLCP